MADSGWVSSDGTFTGGSYTRPASTSSATSSYITNIKAHLPPFVPVSASPDRGCKFHADGLHVVNDGRRIICACLAKYHAPMDMWTESLKSACVDNLRTAPDHREAIDGTDDDVKPEVFRRHGMPQNSSHGYCSRCEAPLEWNVEHQSWVDYKPSQSARPAEPVPDPVKAASTQLGVLILEYEAGEIDTDDYLARYSEITAKMAEDAQALADAPPAPPPPPALPVSAEDVAVDLAQVFVQALKPNTTPTNPFRPSPATKPTPPSRVSQFGTLLCDVCAKDLNTENQDYVKLARIHFKRNLCRVDYLKAKLERAQSKLADNEG